MFVIVVGVYGFGSELEKRGYLCLVCLKILRAAIEREVEKRIR